jgi:hypothetical protein
LSITIICIISAAEKEKQPKSKTTPEKQPVAKRSKKKKDKEGMIQSYMINIVISNEKQRVD